MKIHTFDSNYFRGKSHFEDDDTQNYLLFQPVLKYFKKLLIATIFQRGNQKDCLMKALHVSNNSLVSLLNYIGVKLRVK